VIGHAGQTTEWTAHNTDGILSYIADQRRLPLILEQWCKASPENVFKPYGYGCVFRRS
jgi:hypothetical protein